MPKRCPNGTRRNKTTKKCESKSGSKTSSNKSKTMRKCSKGVSMPLHRIENIIKFEKKVSSVFTLDIHPEYFEKMEKHLENLCFPRNTNWSKINSFSVALHHSNKA